MVIQSEPLALSPYANSDPSSVNAEPLRETVPSSDSVLGSKNTRGSECSESWIYKTLKKKKKELIHTFLF